MSINLLNAAKSLITIGSGGGVVGYIQSKLIEHGINLVVDSFFGKETETAVKKFQKDNGIKEDGVVGPQTAALLDNISIVSDKDINIELVNLSEKLGVDLDLLKAIQKVESNGSGFLSKGKSTILFERYWMYKLLEKKGKNSKLYKSFLPNIVNNRGGGYLGLEKEYLRLEHAKLIDNDCALQSCSWGMFQIMGFHYKKLGYVSVNDFVDDMNESIGNQIKILGYFLESDEALLRSLREKDFLTFALIYNGPKQKGYDKKIKEAYLKNKT